MSKVTNKWQHQDLEPRRQLSDLCNHYVHLIHLVHCVHLIIMQPSWKPVISYHFLKSVVMFFLFICTGSSFAARGLSLVAASRLLSGCVLGSSTVAAFLVAEHGALEVEAQ